MRELGQRGCARRRTSLQLLSESACVLMQANSRVQRRDDANLAQKSREKFAKFPEIRHASRIKKKMHAIGQRALHIRYNVSGNSSSHHCIQIRKRKRPASGSRKFCAQLARKNCKMLRKISARRAHQNCVNSGSVIARTAKLHCSSVPRRRAF